MCWLHVYESTRGYAPKIRVRDTGVVVEPG